MAYLSLYRKWRPQTFDDVVGQQHVVRTLVNALNERRTAHAYLFCGPRGTGKTTVARLLAKGLNCEHGPTGNVCNECDNCRRIAQGNALDVIEIDGASNRGIDEVREIRERVHYAPTQGAYKVYIVDEVHMLTNEAFNALLKILEEPPPHVVFVFATTEAHKIPATIVSRCQRFDFQRFRTAEVTDHLRKVLQGEGVSFEEEALALVARHAEGGMRDALAVLDQCIAYEPSGVTVDVVNEVLGSAPRERLVRFVRTLIEGTLGDLLVFVRELDESGTDLRQFTHDVVGYSRDLMILRASAKEAKRLVTLLESEIEEAAELAKCLTLDQIVQAIEILGEVEGMMRWAPSPLLALEIACVRLKELVEPKFDSADASRQAAVPVTAPAQPMARDTGMSRPDVVQPAAGKPSPAADSPQPVPQVEAQTAELKRQPVEKPAAGTSSRSGRSETQDPQVQSAWKQLLQKLKDERLIQVEAVLREGKPVGLTGTTLFVVFPEDREFHYGIMSRAENRQAAERLLSRILGRSVGIEMYLGDLPPEAAAKLGGPGEVEVPSSAETTAAADLPDHPTLQEALELFGGTVIDIRHEEDDAR